MAGSDKKRYAGGREENEYGAPRDLLNDFESRLSKQVKMLDVRVMNNKNALNQIRNSLKDLVDQCQKSLEEEIDRFDEKVNAVLKKVEKLERTVS